VQQSVLDALEEGILVLRPDRALLEANPAAVAMLSIDLDAARADPDWWRCYRWRSAEDGYPLDTDRLALESGESPRGAGWSGRSRAWRRGPRGRGSARVSSAIEAR
jgi:PAS domain-containing protein